MLSNKVNLIDIVCDKLVFILSSTAKQFFPKIPNKSLKFWWNDELNSLKTTAMNSHSDTGHGCQLVYPLLFFWLTNVELVNMLKN